ncbi:MAG TPA: MltA domain-containing protein [Kofleriaceae bacterium]|nr:MltA domain-containing protein [Kofleriaceae bacterium]
MSRVWQTDVMMPSVRACAMALVGMTACRAAPIAAPVAAPEPRSQSQPQPAPAPQAQPEAAAPSTVVSPEALATVPPIADRLVLDAVTWADVPGWADDTIADALPALLASCAKLARKKDTDALGVAPFGGTAADWRALCAAAAKVPAGDHVRARAMLERELVPYAASNNDSNVGKLTGYYVAEVRASRRRRGRYQVPVYGRPPDLVSVDLTHFVDDARGRRVWGRLDKKTGAVIPYATRAEIRNGALAGKKLELLWADSKVDLLFAEIQGSARVHLDDGTTVWLEFAGKNGQPYKGVGKLLREMGELEAGQGTMQGIRAWFDAHPDRVDEIMDLNPSKVFFALRTRAGARGSQGVFLTPRRSMAIDRAYIAHSTPIWVETDAPVVGGSGTAPWRHLLVAQDTGGGILGPLRGDIYWGDDTQAAEIAGRMGGPGKFWLLLPRSITVVGKSLTPP